MKKCFYITTPIYYTSASFHIGHCYTTVCSDIIARYKRMRGFDVYFLTGTDEHGQKIQRKAIEKGITPQNYVEEIVESAKKLWSSLDISYNDFLRTTEDRHKIVVQKIFEKLYNQDDIYKSEYEGLYCTPCEAFWTETQLKDGKCPDCGRTVELVKEESYFFRMSKYQERLEKYIEDNPNFILPISRKNEMINNFIKPGLQDLCVSRTTFDWGIKVPFNENHVVYVWIDALTNYITALGYMSDNDELFKKYWPADVHIVGKEIVRFHSIIWPTILMALDLPLPKQIFGHGWLLSAGDRISKTTGNYIEPEVYLNKYGSDAIRYFLAKEITFGADGNLTEELIVNKINSDLVNTLGNLVSRTLAMCDKYFNGIIENTNVSEEIDKDLLKIIEVSINNFERNMDKMDLSNAYSSVWNIVTFANKYIDETMPWSLAKDSIKEDRLKTVLYNLIETIRIISVLIQPVLVKTPNKIWNQIGIEQGELTEWESLLKFGQMKNGTIVHKGENIFNRIDVNTLEE